MIELYKNIRELRIAKGWSQTELAKRTGYKDRSAIAHIEDGSIDLPQSKIQIFADVFGVSMPELFGNSGYENEKSGFDGRLLHAFHAAPEGIQVSVCKLLDIESQSAKNQTTSSCHDIPKEE